MQKLFKGYYEPTPEEFKEMWADGTFVFDTNVLLNLYRYKEETKDEILKVIKKLGKRIWIPYQVGLEFHRNRLGVLREQNSNLSVIKNSIRESIGSIEKKCKDLNLDERHSDIETSSFIERFQELSDSVIKDLDDINYKSLTNNIEGDSILNEVSNLFNFEGGTLGEAPDNQEVLNEIYKDGVFRAKNKIPPSFKDIIEADKNKSAEEYYAFEGLYYKKGYGDLIIWNQIIDFAEKNKKRNLVFITDDKKEDWMRVINSHGKKIIGPRPELISEIFKKAGVENFHIYNVDSFLSESNNYLKADVDDKAINDVVANYERDLRDLRDLRESRKINNLFFESDVNVYRANIHSIENLVFEWLSNIKYSHIKVSQIGLFDYIGMDYQKGLVPISLKYSPRIRYRDLTRELLYFDNNARYLKLHIIYILPEFEVDVFDGNNIFTVLEKDFITLRCNIKIEHHRHLLDKLIITVGYVDNESFKVIVDSKKI